LPVVSHPSSYFVWLPLAQDARADRIAGSLARGHISVSTAEPFAIAAPAPQAIRLALGSADLDSLSSTLSTVKQVVEADACL
jgi:DNA-binding transcriptional MocR family regulator